MIIYNATLVSHIGMLNVLLSIKCEKMGGTDKIARMETLFDLYEVFIYVGMRVLNQ